MYTTQSAASRFHPQLPQRPQTSLPPFEPDEQYSSLEDHSASRARSTSNLLSTGSGTETPAYQQHTGVGAEPGIDPRLENSIARFGHFEEECFIDVTEYSNRRLSARRMTNAEFIAYLAEGDAEPLQADENWARRVRWINIGGVDWGVLSALALKYDLHSLALEDVLHERGQSHSKADYYPTHLFLHVLTHSLVREEGGEMPNPPVVQATTRRRRRAKVRLSGLSGFRDPADEKQILRIHVLTRGDRVRVQHEPLFIFLLRDGTVISIRTQPDLSFTDAIARRLRERDSILRVTQDPSVLVQSLLDLIVDRVTEIVDAYQTKIAQLEHDVLLDTGEKMLRSLHILSRDLITHKRTLEPIKTLIGGLRRYDTDRYEAMLKGAPDLEQDSAETDELQEGEVNEAPGAEAANSSKKAPRGHPTKGYLSHVAKVYLAGVLDHIELALGSLDTFSGVSENLIDHAFNMASHQASISMRRLMLISITCLPLTLITQYFGMNFKPFPAVGTHSDAYFWVVAVPVMVVLIPIFAFRDIVRLLHLMKGRFEIGRLSKKYV